MTPKNMICLWFDKDALDAARFSCASPGSLPRFHALRGQRGRAPPA